MYEPRCCRPASILLLCAMLLLPALITAQEDAGRMQASTFAGLAARNLGPGLMSGRIADIAIHPWDRATWYVAAGSGGVWKTVNAGTSWEPIFDAQPSYSIGVVTLDPSNPEVVWVGTGENVSGRHVGFGDGVYRSGDGGRTWTNVGLRDSQHIGKILVHPEDSNVVFAAAEGPLWSTGGDRGLYRTLDGGVTWETVLFVSDDTGVTDAEFEPGNPAVMYAATYQRRRKVWALLGGGPESAIYKSTDGGTTWTALTNGLPNAPLGKIGLAVSPVDPSIVYATISAGAENRGFYRSADRGESWEKRSSYTSGGTGPHYYQEIYASPHVLDRVYQMDVWINVTDDGGRTFRELGEPDKHGDNHAMAFVDDDPDYLLNGSDGGLYESFDHGITWKFASNLPLTQIYKMAVDDAEPFYNLLGGTQDNGTLYGPSRTVSLTGVANRDWMIAYGADGYAVGFDQDHPEIGYVTWQNGHLLRYDVATRETLDIQPQAAPGEEPERWNWDAPLHVSAHAPGRLYYGSQRIWRSDDRGNSWRAISTDLTRGTNRYEMPMIDVVPGLSALYENSAMSWYGTTTAITESPLEEGLIYAGTDDGLVQVTEDGGDSWRRVDALPGVPERAFVNDLRASVIDPDTVFVALDNHKEGDFTPYLLRSSDRGVTWMSIAGDLPDRHLVWAIVQDHVDADLLFAGTEFGLFFTVDGGVRWIELSGGVPTIAFRDIDIQRRESDLVAASFGRGFFILDDYSPLRDIDAAALEADALLFDVRDAWRYVPSPDLGARGKGFQGGAYYNAPNPPFGALITYYVKESPESAREARAEREAELRAQGQDVPFPGWEALLQESREGRSQMVITVRDDEGAVVRRITGPDAAGVHRVAWDLRYPLPDPVDLDPAPVPIYANEPVGPIAAPGTYSVELARVKDGAVEQLAEPRSFRVRQLPGRTLAAADAAAVTAFQRRTAEAERRAGALGATLGEMRTRLAHIRAAILDTPGVDLTLMQRIHEIEQRSADIGVLLFGDRVRGALSEPSAPSIAGRIGQIASGHWYTTEAPTQTMRDSLAIAERGLAGVGDDLDATLADLYRLEADLEAAGAPYTPGRKLGTTRR